MNSQPEHGPAMDGVYASLDGLLRLRFAAQDLSLMPRRRKLGALAGHRNSNFRGRGIEFEEVRRYQAGDDLRAIDWRVTARTGLPHTRLYREERERPILLLIDQRQTMFFGSRRRFKSVQALNCAATLAWAALAGGDRVGGLVCGARDHHEIRPRRSRRTVLRLINNALEANQSLRTGQADQNALSLAGALHELQRIARPGNALFLISDFHDWDPEAGGQLSELARHCELTGLQITDVLERELPPPGRYCVSDGVQRTEFDTTVSAVRADFEKLRKTRLAQLRSDFFSLGAPLIDLDTAQDALVILRQFYRRQRRRHK